MKTSIIKKLTEQLHNNVVWNVEDNALYIKGTNGKESVTYESDLNLNFNLALNLGLSGANVFIRTCPLIEV